MEIFLIIIAINFLISLIAFYVNYKTVESEYLIRDALRDFFLCLIPFTNIMFLISEIIDSISEMIEGKFKRFLDTKLK
jgi:hypothetical protein